MSKESYDDFIRWNRDRKLNRFKYTKITPTGKIRIPAKNVKAGDILELYANERVPADMVLLSTNDPQGTIFLKTDQLDGETDWKLRRSVHCTQNIKPITALAEIEASITAEIPHINIYEFEGSIEAYINGVDIEEGLSLENTVWANTTLASGVGVGIVIYTGKDTRIVMNSREPKNKLGVTDEEINKLAMYLIILMLLISLGILSIAGFNSNSGVVFFRYVLLLSTIIPISLRVNLDFAKIFYCIGISRDPRVGFAKPRNSTIPEELGRIHIVLSDKTGTLTENDMVMKRISMEFKSYSTEASGDIEEFQEIFTENFIEFPEPIPDSHEKNRKRRKYNMVARDLITALSLCHNVTTVVENNKKMYEASSPDEVCLVQFAKEQGVELTERDQNAMVIKTPLGYEKFFILENFPFTSDRKRMGIIVKHEKSEKIIFYLKGADAVMGEFLNSETSVNIMEEECENLAIEGLRTLVVSQKLLEPEEYEDFKERLNEAKASMKNRKVLVDEVLSSIEGDMEYLGVTGVEDKLQENVDTSIESLRTAGIKIWMLTGDKVETAQCIAISTRIFKNKEHEWYYMVNLHDFNEIEDRLLELKKRLDRSLIPIIDGNTLNFVLQHFEQLFIEACSFSDGVVCCRASPTEKSEIVEAMENYTSFRVCAIGDGGNDVGMIESAHIGIGIEGKEGMQASLAADFSISEFEYLTPLVIWHGRLSYQRTSKLVNFIFHRGLIIAVIQAIFFLLFYYVAIPIYNGYLILGYTTIFTSVPVFSLVLDKDSDFETVRRNANLYKRLELGRELNFLRFLVWIWKSVYEGCVIILLALVLFPENSFVNLVAITFSALVLTELLNIASVIQTWNKWIIISELFTLIVYSVCILLLKSYFSLDFIITVDFFFKVLLITTCSWLPIHVGTVIKERCFPDEGRKVRS